jgi:acetoacetyl-CoA synthetase
MQWLERERGLFFRDYQSLWNWSVTDIEAFWQAIWDYFGVRASVPPGRVLDSRSMPGAQWFPGARLNYAEHILRHERAGQAALLYQSETRPLMAMGWDEFAGQVRILATQLRALGVRPGDRVAAYMPNIPQTAIAMVASAAIGAVWSASAPDCGAQGAIDRLQQLAPKVLFCVDGYRYGGKAIHRRKEIGTIVDALDGLEHVIFLRYLDPSAEPPRAGMLRWQDLLDSPPVAAEDFRCAQVPFQHPLWILFSSGTTGLPKAMVHSHGGMVLESLKLDALHLDLFAGDRIFFHTTTGWMMWNFLVSSLLLGVCPVLYDGNPAYPEPDILWKIAQDSGAVLLGSSPAYIDVMSKAGIVPRERFDLSRLRTIMPAGSPIMPEHTAWFYRNVKEDLLLAAGSGGTDCCTGFMGGIVTQPVYAGEMQAPHLGVALKAFTPQGESVVDEVGELVITEPMPSMPVCFWNDPGDRRYRETYFADYPGVWKHGDYFRINSRGGCFVLGRSDATLNRAGVRIGTAEIYRALASLKEIEDALIVGLNLPGGKFFMPLFVTLHAPAVLDHAAIDRIKQCLRQHYTPHHVPDRVIQAPDIPRTLNGKKMEVPVRKILMGTAPEQAANRNAMANPGALDFFIAYAGEIRGYFMGEKSAGSMK